MIIQNLIQTREKRKQITTSGSGPDLVNLTTTLLVVSFTFIILTSPSTIFVLGWNYFGISSGHSPDMVKLCRVIAKMLLNMNNALNFIQYVCSGQKFRRVSSDVLFNMIYRIRVCLTCNKNQAESITRMKSWRMNSLTQTEKI